MSNKRKTFVLLMLIVFMAAIFRLAHIGSIPAWNSDEGRWALGAADSLKYGDWLRGNWKFGFISPGWTGMIYLAFLPLGPSIVHARYLSVMLGLACVVMTFFISRRCGYNDRVALLASLFLAFNTPFLLINRQALSDTAVATALTAAFLLFLGGSRQRVTSAVFLAIAICTKATGVFGALAFYIIGIWSNRGKEMSLGMRLIRPAVLPAVGVALASAVFFILYRLYPTQFVEGWTWELSLRKSASSVFYNPFMRDGLFSAMKYYVARMPLVLLAGIVALRLLSRQRHLMHTVPVTWLLTGIAVVIVQNTQPARYYTFILAPLCIIIAWMTDLYLSARTTELRGRARRLAGYTFAVGIPLFTIAAWLGYYYVLGNVDATGLKVAQWQNENLTPHTNVMGIATFGVGANVNYYPQEYYNQDTYLDDEEIKRYDIDYVLYDTTEWQYYAHQTGSGMDDQLERRFTKVKSIGTVSIWKMNEPAEDAD